MEPERVEHGRTVGGVFGSESDEAGVGGASDADPEDASHGIVQPAESVDVDPTTDQPDTGETAYGESDTGDPTDVQAERDAYFEDLQRVTAEFANFRRQTTKRNAEIVAQAASGLGGSLLPVLDACEAAVSQGVEGVGIVHDQLLGVLKGAGLSVIGEVGDAFDPNLHEAVAFEPSDGIEADTDTVSEAGPMVTAVLRTGYAWKAKVLRPAMVRVKG